MISQKDKFGGNPICQSRLKVFINFITESNLLDLGVNGPRFTWIKKDRTGRIIIEKLDWALCNSSWRVLFPDAHVTHLARMASDHRPLLLNLFLNDPKPKSCFRMQPLWFTDTTFKPFVADFWKPPSDKYPIMTNNFAHAVLD